AVSACSTMESDATFRARTLATLPDWHAASAIAFSPDGRYIAGAVSETYMVWDARTGREVGRLGTPYQAPYRQATGFTPDGRLLVQPGRLPLVNNQRVALQLWDFEHGRVEGTILGRATTMVRDYEVSVTNKQVLVLYDDGEIVAYDLDSLQRVNA